MALLERVARLIKANLNDLVDKAENPEKLLKQLLLDMENQRMQVKTQVAIAIADWHVLDKKRKDALAEHADWLRKAELAVTKGDEKLARVALERSLPLETATQNLQEQLDDQNYQVETLKTALAQLEAKLSESRAQADVLIARYRRARTAQRAAATSSNGHGFSSAARIHSQISASESRALAARDMVDSDDAARLDQLDRSDKVDQLLASLRTKLNK